MPGTGGNGALPDHTTSLTFGGDLTPDSTNSNAPGAGCGGRLPPFGGAGATSCASRIGTCSPTGADAFFLGFAGLTGSGAVSRMGAGTTVNTWRHSRFGQRIDF